MQPISGDSFVVIINYDPGEVLGTFIGLDPVKLVTYLKALVQPAINQIEKAQPDNYEAKGELHQIIWLKRNHNESDLFRLIFRLFLNLLHELERVNAVWGEKGLPPAKFHGGLGEGTVESNAQIWSGLGLVNTYDCVQQAKRTDAILAVSAGILKNIPADILQESSITPFNDNTKDYIVFGKKALLTMDQIRWQPMA